MSSKCIKCEKTVYPNDLIRAIDSDWHRWCLKCEVCSMTLNLNNLNSFERKPYCRAHLPAPKHTSVNDDVMSQHNRETQQLTEQSRSEQLTTQKGTGEKPTQSHDDVMIQHSRETQQLTEQSRGEQLTTQKGTGERPSQVHDDVMIQHSRETQQLTEQSRGEQLTTQKGTGERPDQSTY